MSLEKYRPSMDEDVARSWARDAQVKIDMLSAVVSELQNALNDKYSQSPEGREYLEKMSKVLNA